MSDYFDSWLAGFVSEHGLVDQEEELRQVAEMKPGISSSNVEKQASVRTTRVKPLHKHPNGATTVDERPAKQETEAQAVAVPSKSVPAPRSGLQVVNPVQSHVVLGDTTQRPVLSSRTHQARSNSPVMQNQVQQPDAHLVRLPYGRAAPAPTWPTQPISTTMAAPQYSAPQMHAPGPITGADITRFYSRFAPGQLQLLMRNMRVYPENATLTDGQLLLKYYKQHLLSAPQYPQAMVPGAPSQAAVPQAKIPTVPENPKPENMENQDDFEESAVESTFDAYEPVKYQRGLPHPDRLVESSSLSAVEPPDITFSLTLPDKIFEKGLLSRPQLEGVTYACQAHEQFLAHGERKGYFIGDGAGVGKGRQLSGIIFQNYLEGRKKHIWFSVSADLRVDAVRDLEDIGAGYIKTYKLSDFGYHPIRLASGVIFSTYSTLIAQKSSRGRKTPKTRLDQLIAWCGKDFDGCILLDECHKAKNLGVGTSGASKTATAVVTLQESLPGARVVYCSATGVSSPADMAYLTRLGVWGAGTAFRLGFNDFLSTVERGGLGMMEIVAMHLKRSGAYQCRTLSFAGTEFEIVHTDVCASDIAVYDETTEIWQALYMVLLREINKSNLHPQADNSRRKQLRSVTTFFWGAHQRFFRSLCISLKVQQATTMAKNEVANGRSVIIGLQGTGEASINDAVNQSSKNEFDDFISAPKRTLLNAIDKVFSLKDVEIATASGTKMKQAKGKKRKRDYISSSDESEFSSGLSGFVVDSDETVEEFSSASDEECTVARDRKDLKILNKRISTNRIKNIQSYREESDDDIWSENSEGSISILKGDSASSNQNGGSRCQSSSAKPYEMSERQLRDMKEEGWLFDGDTGVDGWVSKRCRKFYDNKPIEGVIIAYLPGSENEGTPLWHMKHDDGDSEDLDEDEVERFSSFFQAAHQDDAVSDGDDSKGDCSTVTDTSFIVQSTRSNPMSPSFDANDSGLVGKEGIENPAIKERSAITEGIPEAKDVAGDCSGAPLGKEAPVFIDLSNDSDGENIVSKKGHIRQHLVVDSDSDQDNQSKVALVKQENKTEGSVDDILGLDKKLSNPEDITEPVRNGDEAQYRLFRSLTQNLRLHGNPLDALMEGLGGVEQVSEMTGRKGRMLRNKRSGKVSYHRRSENGRKLEDQNIYERNLFQKGKKRIAVISEAASAGISLQADKRVTNQDRRVHITLELPWSANQAVQQLGRSHRSNQSSAPMYKILVTHFGGENRFASAVSKKMVSLGAMTHGDRRSNMETKHVNMAHFNYDSKYGKKALDDMIKILQRRELAANLPSLSDALEQNAMKRISEVPELLKVAVGPTKAHSGSTFMAEVRSRPGGSLYFSEAALVWLHMVGIDVSAPQGISVAKFLNRILGLPFDPQNMLFEVFSSHLEDVVRQSKRDGTFDVGIVEIKGPRPGAVTFTSSPVQVYKNDATKDISLLNEIQMDKGIMWEEAEEMLESALSEYQVVKGPLDKEEDKVLGFTRYSTSTKRGKKVKLHFGYYLTKNKGMSNKHYCVLALEKISFVQDLLPSRVYVYRPRSGRHDFDRYSFEEKYRSLSPADAKIQWLQEFNDMSMGNRLQKFKIVSGSILPIWPVVEKCLPIKVDPYSGIRKASRINIVRASISLADSDRKGNEGVSVTSLIGVRLPLDMSAKTLSDNSAEYEEKRVAEALAASKAAERERMAENISESKTTSFPPKP